MGLKEVQEELKEQIEEARKREAEDIESPKEEPKEEIKEEVKVEDPKKEDPPKSNADFARERRTKMAREQKLSDELAAANARIAELTKPREERREEYDPEPNKLEDRENWLEWKTKQAEKVANKAVEETKEIKNWKEKEETRRNTENLRKRAEEELVAFESEVREANKDYDDVKQFYATSVAYSIKKLNPKISNSALQSAVADQIVFRASQLFNEGYSNPIAEIYEEAKRDGYRPKEQAVEEEKKPDLSRVANNRSRNAGTAGAAGSAGRGELTKMYAATEMTVAEWAKLPPAEKRRLLTSN